ncbi:mitogen-activated protein kinase kinase 9-like [Typha latifolia]|uniref:mitogen-activated protein kinase kinase 9-like n=1 Tax=Typha latifolia TaxID=4733 RepID=UPI003C2DFC18
MALVRDRRPPHLNLTLELPDSSSSGAAADCRLRFPLPPLPPTASTYGGGGGSEYRLSDFEKLEVLGHGNGGTVYKARHRRSSSLYALKLLNSPSSSSGNRAAASREVEILLRTDSPSVVRCHAAFPTPSGDAALVLELMDGGSLDSVLRRRGCRPFPEPALAAISAQALRGLAYLHSHRIVHRDIKPSNLLINAAGEVKIADFGVGKILRRSLDPCGSYVGTSAYMSPERFDPESYGGDYDPYAADVWSLGVAILELHLGYFPLLPAGQRPDWAALMCAICFGEPPRIPETASEELKSFVTACLQKESGKRASVEELLRHPFVAGRDQAESENAVRELLAEAAESS